MFFRNLYYTFKPALPWSLRMGVRRYFAKRKLKKVENIWPINESAGDKPKGWKGWPDEKQFALVLTHDVESQKGLDNVKKLAKLEMELGFRSSFNFIPEGPYKVPNHLIGWLKESGFEVGIHDHRHDGKLYRSRTNFKKSAESINHYIKEWNAKGFRSGFMLHNLDWLHDLDIEYDMSTFDTDPFEPQPDGLGTIFPKWIPKPITNHESPIANRIDSDHSISNPQSVIRDQNSTSRNGYVELPYTLPQDSTLYLIFGEKNCQIWKTKTKWIAEKGGMCLINTHPDYTSFIPTQSSNAFPAEIYRDFLEFINSTFKNQVCKLLPREVTRELISK